MAYLLNIARVTILNCENLTDMKKIILFLATVALFNCGVLANEQRSGNQVIDENNAAITLVSTTELSNLANQWIEAYSASTKIPVRLVINDNYVSNNSANPAAEKNIALLDLEKPINAEGRIINTVGHYFIVPVISANNPYRDLMNNTGISMNAIQNACSQEMASWDAIIPQVKGAQLNIYSLSDVSAQEMISNYSGISHEKIITKESFISLKEALNNDPYGIAFISPDMLDQTNGLPNELAFMPIDKNSNGRLDAFENIYSNLNDLMRGIWIGKFPHKLIKNIYIVSDNPSAEVKQLVNFILQDGQSLMALNGYSGLSSAEVDANLAQLSGIANSNNISNKIPSDNNAQSWIKVLLTLLGGIAVAILVWMVVSTYRLARIPKSLYVQQSDSIEPFKLADIQIQRGLFYDKSHTWAFMQEDGSIKVGMDDFMQNLTGKLTKIIMKNTNTTVKKGEKLFSIIQEGKRLDLYAPVSGVIKSYNQLLEVRPDAMNISPYDKGWVYVIEPENWERESSLMLRSAAYLNWIGSELIRFKEFLTNAMQQEIPRLQHVVLQDGGEVARYALEDLEPQIWDDFQSDFLEKSY